MKSRHIPLLSAITLFSFAGLQAAPATAKTTDASRVEVSFVNADKFTDAADGDRGSDWGRDSNLEILKEHLVRKASRVIPEGQKLVVKITDVDLAGEVEPWRSVRFHDVRIVKDIYPPRIELSFQLLDAAGAVIKEGTRHLSDMSFLMNIYSNRSDARVYEKGLLDDWIRSEFRVKK
jgi:hypothetical protein